MSTAVVTPPTGPAPAPGPTPAPPVPGYFARLKRFTVAEYHDLIRRGVLAEGGPVELLEGYLVVKMSKKLPHILAVRSVDRLLRPLLPADWTYWSQDPLTLPDSEPEPDYALVRGTDQTYAAAGRKPGPADVGLVVEVADTTLADDRADKLRIYARAGIPVYWIVNIPDRQVEVYTDPQPAAAPPAYGTQHVYRVGDAVPVVLDGAAVGTVAVADVVP